MNFKKPLSILILLIFVLLCFSTESIANSINESEKMNLIYDGQLNRWDGYQINNLIIEVDQTIVSENSEGENSEEDFSLLKVYEWKDDDWELLKTITLNYNKDKPIKIKNDVYYIKINKIVDNFEGSFIYITIKSSIESTYVKEIILGGHKNAYGYGNPQIKVIKEISSNVINLEDIITVTISIENIGKYEAYNLIIQDPSQPYFALVESLVNETSINILKSEEKRIVLIYNLKPIEEGIFEIVPTMVSYFNKEKQRENILSEDSTKIHVLESILNKPKIIIKNNIHKNIIKAYLENSKTELKVINDGNESAKNIKIKIILPKEITIKSKELENNLIYIKELYPNSEKTYTYFLKSNNPDTYEINTQYSYSYENISKCKNESGYLESYQVCVQESIIWFLINRIPFVVYLFIFSIIGFISYNFWKKYLEYKY